MERLTMKSPIDNGILIRQKNGDFTSYCFGCRYINRCKNQCLEVKALKKLADYEDAEEQGLLVRLPCNVGDSLYVLDRDRKPREMILDKPDIRCHCAKEDNLCMATCDSPSAGICAYRLKNDGSDFGKTIFLKREAAKQALREKDGENASD